MTAINSIPGSFRDPSGFLFLYEGRYFRQINSSYKENFDQLIQSGLYHRLVESGLLISHKEVTEKLEQAVECYKIIEPQFIPFISYPFEWCFSQLKNAAILTLEIQKIALEFGMSLKDASAYNIQYLNGNPIFIDTLSFEIYLEGSPWVAYRQFCQHFLAPLALMAYGDVRLSQLLRVYLDGLPLDLTSVLLPARARFRWPILMHIFLHGRSQRYFSKRPKTFNHLKINKKGLLELIGSLDSAIRALDWKPQKEEWSDYYQESNYSSEAMNYKREVVEQFIDRVRPSTLWDLGANIGIFSRLASRLGINTVSFDLSPACTEQNYLEVIAQGEKNLLPLILDLTNPSPSLGWANEERMSLVERGPVEMIMVLALIHHLVIGNNLPFEKIASFLNKIGDTLIIEFVPKTDPQVQKLLCTREDIFPDYTQDLFEDSFKPYFSIEERILLKSTGRTLYLMKKVGRSG
jgi:hypothetical protein